MANDHQALSEKLAGLLDINAKTSRLNIIQEVTQVWITQDDGFMLRLMCEHEIDISHLNYGVAAENGRTELNTLIIVCESLKDHSTKAEAVRIAGAKAIIAEEEKVIMTNYEKLLATSGRDTGALELRAWEIYCEDTKGDMDVRDNWNSLSVAMKEHWVLKAINSDT